MVVPEVIRFIKEEELFSLEDKVLVALSGGADSVALLHILIQAGYSCEALHCNFHLRGEESDGDEIFVKELCHKYNISLHTIHFNTKEYGKEHRISIEMAARELRYNWFEEKRKERGAKVIAVAHHRDDSVETFLLNLIRGTGINGLRGIMAKNGHIVRPLLSISRQNIIDYLKKKGHSYVTDSTNLEDDYTRNKIRLNIIPMMEEINPSVKESIADTASRLSEVEKVYRKEIQESINDIKDEKGINISSLLSAISPESVLFEILNPLGFNSKQQKGIMESLNGQAGKAFLSPEWRLIKDRTYLLIEPKSEKKGDKEEDIKIYKEGIYSIGNNKKISLDIGAYSTDYQIEKENNTASLDLSKLRFPLTIRKWEKGDVFIPFGMKGRKKVSDYLTDRKYSLLDKEKVYVVCSENKLVWIIGERSDNRFRIDENTKKIAVLKIIK